jgi:protease IV
MSNFWSSFWGSIVGFIVANILWAIIGMIIFFAVIGSLIGGLSSLSENDKKPVYVKSNSVLHVTLNDEIVERGTKNPFQNFDFSGLDMPLGLN